MAKYSLAPGDKAGIDWVMGKVHVGTPDDEVVEMWRERCAKSAKRGAPLNAAQQRAVIEYALKAHRKNQSLYGYVMGGARRNARRGRA